MTERGSTPSREVDETVLSHPERIQAAIICALVLAIMVKFLVSMVREHAIFDVIYLVVVWGIVFLAITSIFLWCVAGTTVVRKQAGRLTMSLAMGRLVIREVRSVPLTDLKDVVIRERVYGYKGKKIPRYEVVFGRSEGKRELLGFLTRENADLLANGVLHEFLSNERARNP
jgi:hypothetical protein